MKAFYTFVFVVCLLLSGVVESKEKVRLASPFEHTDQRLTSYSYLPDRTRIQLYPCSASVRQRWEIDTLKTDKTIRLITDNKCLDINGYSKDDRAQIWLYGCHTDDKDPSHQNQEWDWNSQGQIVSTLSGKCLDSRSSYMGVIIVIMPCSAAKTQRWAFNATDKTIRNQDAGMCLDAGSPVPGPCEQNPSKSLPFCDYKLPVKTRALDLVSRIKPDEKVGLFGNTADGVPSLSIPPYQWWSEALHGVAGSPGVTFDDDTPVATSFPQVCLTGATFDKDLFHSIGAAIATEARAFSNAGNAGLTFWAPNLNIFRDPRWGRGQETPGEDPYLTSVYVKGFVTGLQNGEDPKYLKVSSCCKHYAAYSLEDYKGIDRHHYNAEVNKQDLADTYFPAFRSCISPESAAGSGIMCSYNSVNGVPSCANDYLLTEVARNTWKFDGYITGDCGAVDDVQYTHKYTTTTDGTCSAVLKAGMDIDCGGFLPAHLQAAVDDGAVASSIIDRALVNLFAVQIRLGIFDPVSVQQYTRINFTSVNTPAHQTLAERAALEGIVLLKNTKDTLPFTFGRVTVAAIGPHAQATNAMQGNYYGNAPFLISPAAGLKNYYDVNVKQGSTISGSDTSGFADACTAAGAAQATVLFVGIDQDIESEGRDRVTISLPGVQDQLVTRVAECAKGKPVVVVVIAGGAVDLSKIKSNPNVSAILWAGYPGQAGGQAIAKIIKGEVSPSGRLDYTIYEADYVNQISFLDMGLRPNASAKSPGRTYRFYTGTPVYPFGFGLSYTTFDYQWINDPVTIGRTTITNQISRADYSPFTAVPLVNRTVVVTNTGKVASDVSVLAFIEGPNAGINGNPIRQLIGFERVFKLQPGTKSSVIFPIRAHDLSFTNSDGKLVTLIGTWTLNVEGKKYPITVSSQ